MMVPYILAAAATHAFSPVAGHAQSTRLQNTRVLRGGQAQASTGLPEAALAGLEPAEVQLATWLASDGGQSHLLSGWEDAALEDKRRLLSQVAEMDAKYPSDAQGRRGLAAYVAHAKELLAESAADKNPFEGYAVEVPEGERMAIGSDAFREDERRGMVVAQDTVFVLVAGGLGERLGYGGIKVELPAETTTGASFLETYATALLAMQEFGDSTRPVQLVIMTSEDTHDKTVSLLKAAGNYGLKDEQIHFIRQSNVPALSDNEGSFVPTKGDAFSLQTKPHGHGDVHTLLHMSGLLPRFAAEGRKYVAFFQDTNVLAFKALPAALGVSERLGFAMNSLTVPRSPGEAAGAICKLVPTAPGLRPLVINVEYNQLDALLQTSASGGDVADATGYSPYPGNVNTLVMKLEPYAQALEATGGTMPEFVNPKYANEERTTFKKPTRLECMMQDFPKLLPSEARVGFSDFERWFSFSPVKNSIEDALKSHKSGVYAASPGAGEAAVYQAHKTLLRLAGAKVAEAEPLSFLQLPLELRPAIALSPRFALTVDDVMRRVPGGSQVTVSSRSTLVLDGDVTLHSLELDGALVVKAGPGVRIAVKGCKVANAGWEWRALTPEETKAAPEAIAIRGYTLQKTEGSALEVSVTEPGDYELTGSGELTKLGGAKEEL